MTNNVTRRVLAASVGVVAAGWIVIGVRAAQDPPAARFTRVPLGAPLTTGVLPRVLDTTVVKVVAILAGESIAQQQETSGRRLTRQEKNALKAQRRAEQAGVISSLQSAGGREQCFVNVLPGDGGVVARRNLHAAASSQVAAMAVGIDQHNAGALLHQGLAQMRCDRRDPLSALRLQNRDDPRRRRRLGLTLPGGTQYEVTKLGSLVGHEDC